MLQSVKLGYLDSLYMSQIEISFWNRIRKRPAAGRPPHGGYKNPPPGGGHLGGVGTPHRRGFSGGV